MTDGLVARFCLPFAWLFPVLGLWLLGTFLSPSALARPSASAQAVSVTIAAVGTRTVQVMGEDGRLETIAYGPASAFLRRGMLVRASEFLPGETALLRRRRAAGGGTQIGLLCDPDSAAVLEKYRGRPLAGTLLSVSPRVWVVQPPSDGTDAVPLSLLVSARTAFQAGGAAATAAAFGPGAAVTVTTRSLPSGLLSLQCVSDAAASDTADPETLTLPTTRRAGFVSGIVTDIQPFLSGAATVTVQDRAGGSHTIAADEGTRVKIRRQPATSAEIAVGMRVSAWLGKREDDAGNPIATSLSAYDALRPKKRSRP